MKKTISIIPLLALLYATACFTQDAAIDENDVFNESQFDTQMEQDIAGEQKNKLEYLPGGTFIFDTNFVTIGDYASYYAFGRLYGTAFLKVTQPDIGVLYLSSIVSSYLFQGTSSTDLAITGQGHDLSSVDFSIAEFYFSFDIAKTLFVRAGKQLVAWGPSLVWTPGDFINLQKTSPLERLDLREGKPLLKLHLPVGGSMNFFTIADFSGTVEQGPSGFVVDDMVKKTNVAIRTDFTAFGFEYGLSGFWGASKDQQYGADIAGSLIGFDVYSELGISVPSDTASTTCGASAGFIRELGDNKEWSFAAEYFYNSAGYSGTPDYAALASDEFTPLYMGQHYLFASAAWKKLFDNVLGITLSCIANLSDVSFAPRMSFSFDIPKTINFTLDISYATGGSGKEFTFFYGDNSLSIALSSKISF